MDMHGQHKRDLTLLLQNANYISETAVVCSKNSVALCCTYLTKPHTHEKISETIQILNHEYGITNKIVATVTDNASNFSKAFEESGFPWKNVHYDPDTIEDDIQFDLVNHFTII